MKNEQMTNTEKTIYTYTYRFFRDNGYSHEESESLAAGKIYKTRELGKKMRKIGFTY